MCLNVENYAFIVRTHSHTHTKMCEQNVRFNRSIIRRPNLISSFGEIFFILFKEHLKFDCVIWYKVFHIN